MSSKLPICSNTKTQDWILHKTTCKCVPKKKGSRAKNLTKKAKYELGMKEFKNKIREMKQAKKQYEKVKNDYSIEIIKGNNTKKTNEHDKNKETTSKKQ